MPIVLKPGTLFISNEDVIRLSTMEEYISVIERAYGDRGENKIVNFQRQTMEVPSGEKGKRTVHLLAAAAPNDNALGAYVYTGGFRGGDRGWQKCLILFDFTRGDLKAIVESEHVSWLKTGAVSAVAAKYLSRKDARTVGIFGAGRQAVTQLEGLCAVRQIKTIKVYSRTEEIRQTFSNMMEEKLGVEVRPALSPREAVVGSDIVVTATTSKAPVFDGKWLEEGTHVTAIGAHYPHARELDEFAVRGHKIVVDTMDSAKECGEFCLSGLDEKDIYAELGDIVAGKIGGRLSPGEITVFKSGGRGFEYVALGDHVYAKAIKA